jgi:probable rRNA maturation factor
MMSRAGQARRLNEKALHLTIDARGSKSLVPFVRKHLIQAHQILKPPLREMSLVLVGDAVMSRLHKEYMDLDEPTDVLTFPIDENPRGQVLSGEVFVCVPEAKRQAKERGTPLASEVLLYSLHGMLHLCGFDDRTERDFRRMHRTEDKILTRLGLGAVFKMGT